MLEIILLLLLLVSALFLCFTGLIFLIFHREIFAISIARRLGPVMDDLPCSQCGECCRLTVIADRQTVKRIARETNMPIDKFARRLPFKLYRMKKGADGACVMLRRGEGKDAPFMCEIYPYRPAACRRFPEVRLLFGVKGCDPRCQPLRLASRSKKGSRKQENVADEARGTAPAK